VSRALLFKHADRHAGIYRLLFAYITLFVRKIFCKGYLYGVGCRRTMKFGRLVDLGG